MKNILNILPYEWQIKEISSLGSVSDIRIKAGQPLILFGEGTEKHIEITPTLSQLSHIVQKASENSVYSYIDDIRQGFITLKGGHRMGISGKAVYEAESLTNIKNVCGINIRIARELRGVASEVFLKLISDGRIHNTVIISPPGGGKTTLLRDMARISGNTKNQRPVLIDSRYEIAAEHKG